MSSSSHEGFITSLSPIACNNRRSRKYGCLVVIARQLSRSDNVRLYADPHVYGPSCILQFLHLVLPLFVIPRGNDASARAKTFVTKLLPRATPPVIENIVRYSFGLSSFPALYRNPSSICYIIPHEVLARCRE